MLQYKRFLTLKTWAEGYPPPPSPLHGPLPAAPEMFYFRIGSEHSTDSLQEKKIPFPECLPEYCPNFARIISFIVGMPPPPPRPLSMCVHYYRNVWIPFWGKY